MVNTMAGYMDNLANAVGVDSGTFAAVNKRLAEITATLESLAESNAFFASTIAEQSKEIRFLRQKINKTNKKGGGGGGTPAPPECVGTWVRDKYCHTHGYGVGNNLRSATCFMPGDDHKRVATRVNIMGGSFLNKGCNKK